MKGEYSFNTAKMHELAEKFNNERRTANRLESLIREALSLSDKTMRDSYNVLISKAHGISEYYGRMSAGTYEIIESVGRASHQLRENLEDNIYNMNHLIN